MKPSYPDPQCHAVDADPLGFDDSAAADVIGVVGYCGGQRSLYPHKEGEKP